jgi:hypothetical protein
VGKTLYTERASNCLPQADNRGAERSEAYSKKMQSIFFDTQKAARVSPRRLFSSFATGVPLKKVELLFELRVEIGK